MDKRTTKASKACDSGLFHEASQLLLDRWPAVGVALYIGVAGRRSKQFLVSAASSLDLSAVMPHLLSVPNTESVARAVSKVCTSRELTVSFGSAMCSPALRSAVSDPSLRAHPTGRIGELASSVGIAELRLCDAAVRATKRALAGCGDTESLLRILVASVCVDDEVLSRHVKNSRARNEGKVALDLLRTADVAAERMYGRTGECLFALPLKQQRLAIEKETRSSSGNAAKAIVHSRTRGRFHVVPAKETVSKKGVAGTLPAEAGSGGAKERPHHARSSSTGGIAASALAGAAAGAVAGSFIPGFGNAVGTVVGLATGIVAGYVASKTSTN